MRMLLIEPNIEGRVGEPPLNIAILKSFVNNKSDHNAKVIDLTFHQKDWKSHLTTEIDSMHCDLIGISCLSFNYSQALEIASYIKSNYNIKIIFGGVHVILSPDDVIKNEVVDIICTGEGEHVLKNLLNNNLDCNGIKGVWYKANGEIVKNEQMELIQNLDEIPFPDWDDYELEKYFLLNASHLPIMASRGCPYSCTYCSNHALKKELKGTYVRFRSAENLIEEIGVRIDQYLDRGMKHFQFNDDTFILHKKFVIEFCERYKQKGYDKKILWTANVRANLVTDEVIKSMKSAGCYEVGMGVESSNDYIRNVVYKRNMSKEQIFNAISIIKKYGLQLHVPLIIGAPYETLEMMEENLKFAKEINAECMLFPILMPLPKTEIRKICEKEGLIEEEKFSGAHIMYTKPVVRTKYVNRKNIAKFVSKVRRYLIVKYFMDGIKMKGPKFLLDILIFFFYYKPKYNLEIDNAWKFTIHKYSLEKIRLERHLI